MTRPLLELADVFKSLDSDWAKTGTQSLNSQQRRAFRDIIQCRTAALGGHVEQCTQCSHEQIAYNSCRNRNCPKCRAAARKEWTQKRAAELLPVEYFHVVFTLPDQLSPLALQNKRVIYGLLFQAAVWDDRLSNTHATASAVELVFTNVGSSQPIRRFTKVSSEIGDASQISLDGSVGIVPQVQIIRHPLSQRGHSHKLTPFQVKVIFCGITA